VTEGLAKDPYVAAGVAFEPVTLRMQGTELTTEPPCPRITTKDKLICYLFLNELVADKFPWLVGFS